MLIKIYKTKSNIIIIIKINNDFKLIQLLEDLKFHKRLNKERFNKIK